MSADIGFYGVKKGLQSLGRLSELDTEPPGAAGQQATVRVEGAVSIEPRTPLALFTPMLAVGVLRALHTDPDLVHPTIDLLRQVSSILKLDEQRARQGDLRSDVRPDLQDKASELAGGRQAGRIAILYAGLPSATRSPLGKPEHTMRAHLRAPRNGVPWVQINSSFRGGPYWSVWGLFAVIEAMAVHDSYVHGTLPAASVLDVVCNAIEEAAPDGKLSLSAANEVYLLAGVGAMPLEPPPDLDAADAT